MKDRVLLMLAGLACAGVALLTWSEYPAATFGFVLFGLFLSYRENRRIERVKSADRERVARARARQLARLARMLSALRDRRR